MAATALARRTLFPGLLNKLRSIPGRPATPIRSLSSHPRPKHKNNSDSGSYSDSDSDDEHCGFHIPGVFHPFPQMWKNAPKLGGGRGTFDVQEDEAGLRVRMDMAGLAKEHVKVWVEGEVVYIRGEGPEVVGDCEGGDVADGRRYGTKIRLPAKAFKLSEIHAEVKNGVLKVLVPTVEKELRDIVPVEVI